MSKLNMPGLCKIRKFVLVLNLLCVPHHILVNLSDIHVPK